MDIYVERARAGELTLREQAEQNGLGAQFAFAEQELVATGVRRMVAALCRLRGVPEHDVDDVHSMVALKMLSNPHTIDIPNGILPMVNTITERTIIDRWRSKTSKGRRMETLPLDFASEATDNGYGPDSLRLPPTVDHADGLVDVMAVREALNTLSADQQDVIRMRYYEDMTTSEIAAALAIPEGTVKSRLSYAQSHLRRTLSADTE